jgi:hypothetical protein
MARQTLPLETAEEIAARALAFLAAEPARLSRFLALTGIEPGHVREEIGSPALLSAVLDHLVHDEPLLLVFAASTSLAPDAVGQALASLEEARRRQET